MVVLSWTTEGWHHGVQGKFDLGDRAHQTVQPVSRRNEDPRFQTPEADLGRKEFNWCPVPPAFCKLLLEPVRVLVQGRLA